MTNIMADWQMMPACFLSEEHDIGLVSPQDVVAANPRILLMAFALGTTFKADVPLDVTNLPKKSRKAYVFLIEEEDSNSCGGASDHAMHRLAVVLSSESQDTWIGQETNKMKCVTKDHVKPTVLAPGKYAIDVEPIPPCNRNNREVHLDYLKHLKESVETLREIVKEAKVERPLDRSIVSACRYTKHSQELLEYAIGTCPNDFNQQDKKHAPTPLIRKKQVAFEAKYETSNSITHKHVEQLHTQKTNVLVPPSTGVNSCTDASGSQPRSNTKKKNRISLAKSVNETKVKEHPRTNKSNVKTANRFDYSIRSKHTVINSNSHSVCQTCNKCLISVNHDVCMVNYFHSVNASPSVNNVVRKVKQVWKSKQVRQMWKATGKVLTNVGYQWRPTGRTFTLGE
ncbi:hypothetical protein Tco_0002753 [Tanacetum coccineum]